MPNTSDQFDSFDLRPGRVIGGKYVVDSLLGGGWEGEVYRVTEQRTGAPRAAKLFFPIRNERDKAVDFYAKKLEQLRDCQLLIKYHHSEFFRFRGQYITVLISEYVDGYLLEDYIKRSRGKRVPEFEALRILYSLTQGLEHIHAKRDYHGDLHAGNVLIQRRGVHFDIKLVDLYNLGRPTKANIQDDVIDCVRLLYDMLGGKQHYAKQRNAIKQIICGLKRATIAKRYPNAGRLREHLDTFEWDSD